MNLSQLVLRVRSNVNDLNANIFKKALIENYLNEAVDRLRNSMYFVDMEYLVSDEQIPIILPTQYHHLLAIYATSKCHENDERHFQAGTRMNEFEDKFLQLVSAIENGEVTLRDADGVEMEFDFEYETVKNVYYDYTQRSDLFEGVE